MGIPERIAELRALIEAPLPAVDVPALPVVLHETLLSAILAFPDDMLLSWFATQPASIDALSVREREHALAILSGKVALTTEWRRRRRSITREAVCAAYIRQQLVGGDHRQAHQRAKGQRLEVGGVVMLDGRPYTITAVTDRTYHLVGERGGKAQLTAPFAEASGRWSLWAGGAASRHAKLRWFARNADGAFTAVR